jgi:TonB family protein
MDRQDKFQPDSAPRMVAPATANVIVLAEDATLLEMIKHSLEGRQKIWRADDALHAADLLVASQSGILFVDAAVARGETAALIDSLHEQFPDFPIVVTGRREDEIELGERISTGAVFRFLHKPVSAERVRNFIDAAVRRSAEQPTGSTPPASDAPSAPARALSTVRSIRLPRMEIDPARVGRALRTVAWIAVVPLFVWGLVTVVQQKPWERISLPVIAGLAMTESREKAPATDRDRDSDSDHGLNRHDDALARVLGAAGIALGQGRLVEPPGQNALELYRRVLQADPGNVEAREGLAKTTDELLLRVEQCLLAEDLSGAASALDAARSADPTHPRLEFFSSQLVRERDRTNSRAVATAAGSDAAERAQGERVTRLLSLADQRMKQGKLVGGIDSAQAYVLDAHEAAPGDPGVQQALNALSGRMLLVASEAMHQGDMIVAGSWLDRAESIGVDGKAVARLRAEIASARVASVHEDRSRLLALANQRIAQGRLLEPASDSARHYADLLQAADPGFEGLAETEALLAARLLERARQLSASGRHAQADILLAAAENSGAREVDLAATGLALADDRSQTAAAQEVAPEATLNKIKHRAPVYPARAEARGVEGWVDVQFTVATDGSTRDIVASGSSPAGVFEESVLDAIRDWRYQPRVVAGKPVDQRVELRVSFKLRRN